MTHPNNVPVTQEALVDALRPFARQKPHHSEDGSHGILVPATVADVRLARDLLARHRSRPQEGGELVERLTRLLYDGAPHKAVSPALAELTGLPINAIIPYDKLIEVGGDPVAPRVYAKIVADNLPFLAALSEQGGERALTVAWLRADADLTETESRKFVSNSHGLTPRDVEDWQNLVSTKRGIANAIERGDHLTKEAL